MWKKVCNRVRYHSVTAYQLGYITEILLLFTRLDGEPEPSGNTLRILSWNLDGLSVEKARNPGVVTVISKILLRYHISIAVLHGVIDPLGLIEVQFASTIPTKS